MGGGCLQRVEAKAVANLFLCLFAWCFDLENNLFIVFAREEF